MKIRCCDVCRMEKQTLRTAPRYWTFKRGSERLTVDVCKEHGDWGKGRSYDKALELFRDEKPVPLEMNGVA